LGKVHSGSSRNVGVFAMISRSRGSTSTYLLRLLLYVSFTRDPWGLSHASRHITAKSPAVMSARSRAVIIATILVR